MRNSIISQNFLPLLIDPSLINIINSYIYEINKLIKINNNNSDNYNDNHKNKSNDRQHEVRKRMNYFTQMDDIERVVSRSTDTIPLRGIIHKRWTTALDQFLFLFFYFSFVFHRGSLEYECFSVDLYIHVFFNFHSREKFPRDEPIFVTFISDVTIFLKSEISSGTDAFFCL